MRKHNEDLKEKLKLHVLDCTNKTMKCGKFGLPEIFCPKIDLPDYIALCDRPGEFNKTDKTIVGSFLYDNKFDTDHCLFMCIYHNDEKKLNDFINKYKNVKYFIETDRSQVGDVEEALNLVKRYMSRVEALWITLFMDKLVVPLITYSNEDSFSYMLDGIEKTVVVCFSTKGSMLEKTENELLIKAISYTVDNLKFLKSIIVYSTCSDDNTIYETFKYATEKGIDIIIPDNSLMKRNRIKNGKND